MAKLMEDEINKKLEDFENWIYANNSISKEYEFEDFVNALGFVVKAGMEAEKMNHHPDLHIYAYKHVKVTITTHDEGGVTEKDFDLAQKIERF